MSLEDRRAMDITLNGHDPVLLGAAKMTLIVPKGGLEGISLRGSNSPGSPDHWNDVAAILVCLLGRAGPSDPTDSCNLL